MLVKLLIDNKNRIVLVEKPVEVKKPRQITHFGSCDGNRHFSANRLYIHVRCLCACVSNCFIKTVRVFAVQSGSEAYMRVTLRLGPFFRFRHEGPANTVTSCSDIYNQSAI